MARVGVTRWPLALGVQARPCSTIALTGDVPTTALAGGTACRGSGKVVLAVARARWSLPGSPRSLN